MSKPQYPGMVFHQALSFSRTLMRVPKAEAIFWPGCALMNLDPAILQKTLTILHRAEPDIGLATGCCGQPTVYLFPGRAEERRNQLVGLLKKRGIKRIYTACPNCTLQLKMLDDFEVISVWAVLADCIRTEDIEKPAGSFVWHDPCPTKADAAQQNAVRRLLEISCSDWTEPEHTGAHTICCGNFHMMEFSAPEQQQKMRARRLVELPEECTILSSCEGCLSSFRSSGRKTCHLLELLFGESKSRGWGNRIKTTLKAPIK